MILHWSVSNPNLPFKKKRLFIITSGQVAAMIIHTHTQTNKQNKHWINCRVFNNNLMHHTHSDSTTIIHPSIFTFIWKHSLSSKHIKSKKEIHVLHC
ncbi:hypothetical protein HanPI659440_Chr05g0184151 [Helianthus annuus]|nr:hypothetical protein HanPI659440_Chr05g0184151 [Helianthus annuus]